MFSANAYLSRLHISNTPEPTLSTLQKLQYRHLLHIPFENLDIHYGNPIILDTDRLFKKIITRNRGGFCYELNGLFHELLCQMGYQSNMVSARVYNPDEESFSPKLDHMAIIVRLDKTDLLVDVGFGDFTYAPLDIGLRSPQENPRGRYRIQNYDSDYLLVQHQEDQQWQNEYMFTRASRSLDDFTDRCHFHQTSEESHFSKKKVCSKATEQGRITLTHEKLKITTGTEVMEQPIDHPEEFEKMLTKYFDFDIRQYETLQTTK